MANPLCDGVCPRSHSSSRDLRRPAAAKAETRYLVRLRFYRALSILLSSRLRSTVKHLQGEHWRPVTLGNEEGLEELDELLSMGGIRFDWMLKRMRHPQANPWDGLDMADTDAD